MTGPNIGKDRYLLEPLGNKVAIIRNLLNWNWYGCLYGTGSDTTQ